MYTHYFRYFEEIVREGSFTKAAKNLYISQQSLSEHIKRMEEHYGIQLFSRKPSLHLTHAGELLLEYINKTMRQEEQLLSEFSYISLQQKGKIRVGITPTRAPIFFPLIFAKFNKLYPLVELSLREDHTSYLMKDLTEGKIDFIIGLDDPAAAQNQMIASTPLLQDRKLYFLASKELLQQYALTIEQIEFAGGVSLNEIAKIPIILKPNTSRIHTQILQAYIKLGEKPKIIIESSNVLSMLPLCSAGNAGVFMPHTILRHIKEHYPVFFEHVYAFPVRDIKINCDIALTYFVNKPVSAHFKDFIETTKNVFAEYLEANEQS
jgi:DNA-binding transcriptional LysR family regulator